MATNSIVVIVFLKQKADAYHHAIGFSLHYKSEQNNIKPNFYNSYLRRPKRSINVW